MGMRILAGCAILSALLTAPFAHAQSNVVLVTTAADLIAFFTSSEIFDDVAAAVAFANMPTSRIDTILIDEGSWPAAALEEIIVPLKIEGLGHPKDVILQGTDADPVFTVSGTAELILESLTLTGGSNGVHALEESTLIVNRCIIRGNDEYGVKIDEPADPPAGFSPEHAIYNSAITDNSSGGILANTSAGLLTVLGCTLIDNGGDAIALPNGADAEINNTLIYRNEGVGITGDGGTINFDFNYIKENLAPSGGTATLVEGLNNIDTTILLANEDPFVDLEPLANNWKGKVLNVNDSPLRDNGNDLEASSFTVLDLDGDLRTILDPSLIPERPLPSRDIGADEVGAGLGGGAWFFAEVFPSPAPAMAPRELSVRVRLAGSSVEFLPGTANEAFILTESLNLLPLDMIQLSTGFYAGTNLEAILADMAGLLSNDGLALIQLLINNVVLDPSLILPDAEAGRMFIIDTFAPFMLVQTGGLTANFFATSNGTDIFTATPPVPAGVWRPALMPEPFSAGLIRPLEEQALFGQGQAAQIFFNAGPDPNAVPDINIRVNAEFIDVAPDGLAGGGFDIELEINSPITLTTGQLTGKELAPFSMPRWILGQGSLPSGGVVEADFTMGDPLVIPPSVEPIFPTMTVVWTIAIPKSFFSFDDYHLAIRFTGQDEAGNLTKSGELLDPLHIWYMATAQTALFPYYDTEVERPSFEWGLSRPSDPGPSEPSGPRFRYRLLQSQGAENPKVGPYVPVSTVGFLDNEGWSPFFSGARSLPFEWFNQPGGVIDNLPGTWLILVVTGADEAGNMEVWPGSEPFSGLTGIGNGPFTLTANAGRNWQRFLIPGRGEQIETTINAEFWWDSADGQNGFNGRAESIVSEAFFGESKIIPLPPIESFNTVRFNDNELLQLVEAKFRIQVMTPSAQKRVQVQLFDVSNPNDPINFPLLELFPADFLPGRDSVDVGLLFPNPVSGFRISDLPVGDPERQVPRRYVLQARGVSANGVLETTPSNYAFTVVPSVQGYIENKQSADDQPIKVIESN